MLILKFRFLNIPFSTCFIRKTHPPFYRQVCQFLHTIVVEALKKISRIYNLGWTSAHPRPESSEQPHSSMRGDQIAILESRQALIAGNPNNFVPPCGTFYLPP